MNRISYQGCIIRIKQLIAKIKGVDWMELRTEMPLREKPIRFNKVGLRAMANRLNKEFHTERLNLSPDQTGSDSVETLGQLCNLVWDALPPEGKTL